DDDDAVHRHAGQHGAHGLDGRAVGTDLVATSHPAAGGHGGGLGGPHEVHGEVAVGRLSGLGRLGFWRRHGSDPSAWGIEDRGPESEFGGARAAILGGMQTTSDSDTIVVEAGGPLSGTVTAGGAKNSALKLMVACLLAEGRSVLSNVPCISDVDTMAEVLRALGAEVERL